MPVNGASKVESNCLSMCGRVEPFTSLGTSKRELKVPPHFWRELAIDHEAVSNFIVCLVARLISLNSAHGLDPLVSVYRDLVELPVDQGKYRGWASKSLPEILRPAALELQHSIVTTVYFLTGFYSYRPTVHLRHIYLRWNLARNYSGGDGSGKLADSFEEKVLSPFSVAQSKEVVVHPPPTQLSLGETTDGKILGRLLDHCCQNHRRAHFGLPPPEVTKLCLHSSVSEALAYVGLRDLITRSLLTGAPAVHHLLLCLGNMAVHGQSSSEQGDREDLLPLLQLLRDLVTMLFPLDRGEAYRAVMPFYMWPVAHAECSRRLLSLLAQEGKVPGTSFRRKLLVENNLGLQLRNTEIRGQFVHMLVDVSMAGSHGDQFSDVFSNRHDLPTSESLHRTIVRSCFKSVFPSHDMSELETHLQGLSPGSLAAVCCECVEVMEAAVARKEAEFGEGIPEDLVAEMNRIHQRLIQETGVNGGSEEQRDSAVSCSSGVNGSRDTLEEAPGIFALPSPDIPTHTLALCKHPLIQAKLREVLVQCQKQLSPVVSQRTFSQTSMDSTGSSHMDQDSSRTARNHLGEGGGGAKEISLEGGRFEEIAQTNGRCSEEEEEESCDNHLASPDSGHVRSPDPVTPFSPPSMPDEEERRVKKRRSHSTEIPPPVLHSPELNGDGGASPNSSDEVFNQCPNSQGSSSSDQSSPHTRGRTAIPGKLTRRKTVPAKLHPPPVGPHSRGTRTSVISHAPSYGTSRKGYTNIAGTPTVPVSAVPLGSRILSTRRGSMSLPKKRTKIPLAGAGSPVHASSPKLRVLKIVLAGSDQLVCHTAKAYAHLLTEEPNLLTGLDVRFYHVPLSTATTADWLVPERSATAGNRDALEAVVGSQTRTCGMDVNIGRYISHLDSWYERNVALAVHHSLRLLPPIMSQHLSPPPPPPPPPPSTNDTHFRPPLTPSKVLVDSVAHYLREANHCIKAKLYKIKMILKTEKQHRMENREMIMLHRLDIQRLSGKKNHRQAKTFEANLQLTELSLDGSFVRPEVMPMKEVWSVRASNIPSASDATVANPESECFELSVVTAHTEGGRFTKSRLTEQTNYHTQQLTLETKKDPLTVMVDGDSDALIDNVIRLEITPAYQGSTPPSSSGVVGGSRSDRQLSFPLMTFWPIDL